MPTIEVNGKHVHYKVSPYNARLSMASYRRKIIEAFQKIGIEGQYLDIQWGGGGGYTSTGGWAEVSWIVNGESYNYKCSSQNRDVDNLAAIAQIIDVDSKAIRRGLKTFGQVMNQFRIGYEGDAEKIKTPRQILGVPEDMKDWDYIKFKYKKTAKEMHPDQGGDPEKFQKLHEAYQKLNEELGGE